MGCRFSLDATRNAMEIIYGYNKQKRNLKMSEKKKQKDNRSKRAGQDESIKIEVCSDGTLAVYTNRKVKVLPANDDKIKDALEAGARMADGSIFAGLTADGKQQIFAMPTDHDVTMTFNDAAKAVKKLNSQKALGHDDWQIPSLENVRVLYKNQNEGALKGTFNTSGNKGSGSGFPGWYWSSTEGFFSGSYYVHNVRFSDGNEAWNRKDNDRLSCRPVRLVAAPSLV